MHSIKTLGSNLTRKGSIGAKLHSDDPEISQPDAEYDPELFQSDLIICQVCGKLTDFWVILDLEWSLAPMDPFRVKFDPGVFRVAPGNDFLSGGTGDDKTKKKSSL